MNKQQLKNKCKSILDKTPINNYVQSKNDFDFLMKIFSHHEEWEDKLNGQEIIGIIVQKDPIWKKKCFHLVRKDFSTTDISYLASITNISPKANVTRACRFAEMPRIKAFIKTIVFPYTYTFNGKETTIHNRSEMDIDHYDVDFDSLINNWVNKNGGFAKLAKKINNVEDMSYETKFTDESLTESFANYAKANSKLRVLSKWDNRSTRKKHKE